MAGGRGMYASVSRPSATKSRAVGASHSDSPPGRRSLRYMLTSAAGQARQAAGREIPRRHWHRPQRSAALAARPVHIADVQIQSAGITTTAPACNGLGACAQNNVRSRSARSITRCLCDGRNARWASERILRDGSNGPNGPDFDTELPRHGNVNLLRLIAVNIKFDLGL
jgi:hypothetical protein